MLGQGEGRSVNMKSIRVDIVVSSTGTSLHLGYTHAMFTDLLDRQQNHFNPLTAKLFNLNFHPLEVVSR